MGQDAVARQQMLDEISEFRKLAEEGGRGGLIADDIAQNLKIVEIIHASVPDEETRRRRASIWSAGAKVSLAMPI